MAVGPWNGSARRWSIPVVQECLPAPDVGILAGASLFLDLDGTLLELADRPDDVRADDSVRGLLRRLSDRMDGRLAIVSGRSLRQIGEMLGPGAGGLVLAGSHGVELYREGRSEAPARSVALDEAASRLRRFAGSHAGVLVEEKSFGVALHYRMVPASEPAALEVAGVLAGELGLQLQRGRMMVELRVGEGDKGTAIRRLMQHPPMLGSVPVFAGDDVTDEPGFAAVRAMGGQAILVGAPRPTNANLLLACPASLREWLAGAVR